MKNAAKKTKKEKEKAEKEEAEKAKEEAEKKCRELNDKLTRVEHSYKEAMASAELTPAQIEEFLKDDILRLGEEMWQIWIAKIKKLTAEYRGAHCTSVLGKSPDR